MKLEDFDLSELVPADKRMLLDDCTIRCAPSVLARVSVNLLGNAALRHGYRIELTEPGFVGKLLLGLGPGTGRVNIATRGPALIDVRNWRGGTLEIGAGTTINSARIVCDDADVVVGEDGLWSDEVLIQSNDQHGIVDSATGQVLNAGRRRIVIGPHVWLGRRTTVMPDVMISAGCILAAGSVLTKNTPRNTIFAGVPAREVRSGVTWSRSPGGMSESERAYLENPPD